MKTELVDLLKMSQEQIKEQALQLSGAKLISEGNVFAEGTVPMVLVAHMDTVYPEQPTTIIDDGGKLYTPKGTRAGIGGDDRCGCYCLFEASKWEFKPSLLFCSDEETIGNASSNDLWALDWSDYKCFVEVDGPGFGVFYSGTTSNRTLNRFLADEIGLTELQTSFNDISNICQPGNPPGVTLGAAYYNQHEKDKEWISSFGLKTVVETIKQIVRKLHKLEYSVVEESRITAGYSNYYGYDYAVAENKTEKSKITEELWEDLCSGNCFQCEMFEACLNLEEDLCSGTGCFTCQMFDQCVEYVTKGGFCSELPEYTTDQEEEEGTDGVRNEEEAGA